MKSLIWGSPFQEVSTLWIIPSGLYNITDDSKEKMVPRKDEGSYWEYKEQGKGQLQSVQSFQLTTNKTSELR